MTHVNVYGWILLSYTAVNLIQLHWFPCGCKLYPVSHAMKGRELFPVLGILQKCSSVIRTRIMKHPCFASQGHWIWGCALVFTSLWHVQIHWKGCFCSSFLILEIVYLHDTLRRPLARQERSGLTFWIFVKVLKIEGMGEGRREGYICWRVPYAS